MEGNRSKESKTGTVKRWFDDKGFGFIKSGEKDFFVHVTKLEDGLDKLEIGQSVEFYTMNTPKGEQAVDVTVK